MAMIRRLILARFKSAKVTDLELSSLNVLIRLGSSGRWRRGMDQEAFRCERPS